MEQQCERVGSGGGIDPASHSPGVTHILRRSCKLCGNHQVIYICAKCEEYIRKRNEAAKDNPGFRMWRCMKCGKSRPMPQGMDIIGRA